MGAALCANEVGTCPCKDAHGKGGAASITLHNVYDSSASPPDPSGPTGKRALPASLDAVQGQWQKQSDGMYLGEIVGDQLIWDPIFQHEPTVISVMPTGQLSMELDGERHLGHLERQALLCWSDGEVWVKPA
mmetsp:Transcript_57702/g.167148  ORF Transcript_57702/g.167148 Transcript_57702/m.167148 type:complete len:132 (-) Transcript_57702:248-643(-)